LLVVLQQYVMSSRFVNTYANLRQYLAELFVNEKYFRRK